MRGEAIGELRDQAVDALRVLHRAGGEAEVVAAMSAVIRVETRPLKHGKVKASATYRMGEKRAAGGSGAVGKRRARRGKAEGGEGGHGDHGLPGG